MNNQKGLEDGYLSLCLLEERLRGDAVTQRELSSKLGVAPGQNMVLMVGKR